MRGHSFLKNRLLIGIAIASAMAMSFRPVQARGKLILHFENYVGEQKLILDTVTYLNELGQPFTVINFKYYVSNISLLGADGSRYTVRDRYILVRQDDESTWTATLDEIPAGEYRSVRLVIGVDSLHNCSGAQSDALDPVNGMFWAWNSGYIFLKLEGKSTASRSPGGIFEYHIGGYKAPNNFIRSTYLSFDAEPCKIKADKATTLYIKTDVSEILKHPHTIDFSTLSSVTDYHHAAEIADNYTDIFSLIRIGNE